MTSSIQLRKLGNNEGMGIGLSDLVYELLDGWDCSYDRKEFFNRFFEHQDFPQMLKDFLVKGSFNEETEPRDKKDKLAGADPVRLALLEAINDIRLELVTNLLKREDSLMQVIENQKEQVKAILNQWPKSHEQYKPKIDFFFPKMLGDAKDKATQILSEL